MIEETARIIEVSADFAWVETQRKSSCASCSVNKGCGTATLAKLFGPKRTRLKVLNSLSVQAGDEVVIGLQENALLQGSLAVYIVPLAAMLLLALLAETLNTRWGLSQAEGCTIFFGLLGLAGGFLWVKRYTTKISRDERYQPVILRRVTHPIVQPISTRIIQL